MKFGGDDMRPGGPRRIGIDVGGTFTDGVLVEGTGTWSVKTPSRPDALGEGIVEACRLLAVERGETLEALMSTVTHFGLGTTAITNVIASRVGRRVGLLTTSGFEEMFAIPRNLTFDDLGWVVPQPGLVPKDCIVGLDERVDRHGVVLRPLDVSAAVAAARRLVEERGVEALAVSFLWSIVNPVHEAIVVEAVREEIPSVPVTSGADLSPVIREYERTMLAVLNAYVGHSFEGVATLGDRLRSLGLQVPVLLVHSNGGSISIDEARWRPILLAESGPAAGVAAAALLSDQLELGNVLTCDMGGTSFDISDVTAGVPFRVRRGDLMGVFMALPRVDVESIGAGGGSIGWADSRGLLHVGPRSAGSQPGPACYGRGGSDPTVTDALVVLGYLDPGRFLGGRMRLDVDAAEAACGRLGEELGITAREAAWGIRQIALAEMAKAARGRLAVRGLDPATFNIMSYGGCAALFTAEIASAIGARRVLVPKRASVLSAVGAATTEVRRERQVPVLAELPLPGDLLHKIGDELRDRVEQDLLADGVPTGRWEIELEADVRFAGQRFDLSVAFDGHADEAFVSRFSEEYARRYGRGSTVRGATLELVGLRAVGSSRTFGHRTLPTARSREEEVPARASRRPVVLDRTGEPTSVSTYDDSSGRLPRGRLPGPLLIDRPDTTVWIPGGWTVESLPDGTLDIELP
jgi:N-methylhydantoinase A